ncbi:Uma2 family endonuclease [Pseudanabaena sp. UWO311]|uniref:Uma2 family endonuclease n=1 Tax=Pseudanabaena sp. UWO311 TaxID=2487337 RepID=UPI00115C100E|nr:Uma2 family endonuclease [Pseudanabaena sp. UWO311]TYQ27627.1 Uma2 family endonuclease [Pseudanabaena sp. UWO311]
MISDSTLNCDREVKIPLYAKSGIPEVWIVNIEEQIFEVYKLPNQDSYEQVQTYGKGEPIPMNMFADMAIVVDEIF